ncbi:MAG: GNAT family N-acetyltransferase [Clostridiales bacterium]|nr:GNAT family N-acetyltransferase [Clostridiales bacterium]
MFIIENDLIGLSPYTHADDADMFACWQNIDTQKGYNGIFNQTFNEFKEFNIEQFTFWVTVTDKKTSKKVGVLRLGLDEICPDLAIWIYPRYRNRGYGTQSFALALKYIFEHFPYSEISAGCFEDNISSIKMLTKIGFVRYPDGDVAEKSCFTGETIRQLEFRITSELARDIPLLLADNQ